MALIAVCIVSTCWAITERTYKSILLNSSKQHHPPDWANPLKNFLIAKKFKPSEQLNTTHITANAFAKSLTV